MRYDADLEQLMEKEMPRVSQQVAKQTRKRIIESAIKIVTLEGSKHLTFSNIAKKADISRSGINCHFKRKEDLMDEIRPVLAERVEQALDFSSPDNFFQSWRNAVDNDRMFRNLIANLEYVIDGKTGTASLIEKIQGDKEEVIKTTYMAIGYAVIHIGNAG